jgi:catechol 2,3-dioxygenase-like lactoylglutathione lyase family enzyme
VPRIQLALNVSNLDDAVDFYSKFFKASPAKVRPGYANFAIDDPPLKLVLIEGGGAPGTINHLGVEVFSSDEVLQATEYLRGEGIPIEVEDATTCCFAVQDKVWAHGPDASRWEVYTVLADAGAENIGGDSTCCGASDEVAGERLANSSACC